MTNAPYRTDSSKLLGAIMKIKLMGKEKDLRNVRVKECITYTWQMI